MEMKNCPDPRNCSKIHYFGKCPYNHQPCNRGTACPYVNQNNCQFYHPEEDYPQYKAKRAAKAKEEKPRSVITHLKIVTKPSSTQLTSMASKAFAEMAGLKKYKPSTSLNSFSSKASSLSKSNKIIQPPVQIVGFKPLPQAAIRPLKKMSGQERNQMGACNSSRVVGSKNGLAAQLIKPKVPQYIKKIKDQEEYIRDLEDRIKASERTLEVHRGRIENLKSSKQKFFTCWSRAVKTLELVLDSGTRLDESIVQVINIHSASLRRHEPIAGVADLNPSEEKPRYFLHNRGKDKVIREERDIYPARRGGIESIGYDRNSMFTHEPGSGFAEHDQISGRNRTEDNNLMQFVVEDMLSCLEL